MAIFDLLFTAAEVALGGLIIGSASMRMRRSPRG